MNIDPCRKIWFLAGVLVAGLASGAFAQEVRVQSDASASSSASVSVEGGAASATVKSKASASTSINVGAPSRKAGREPLASPSPTDGISGGASPYSMPEGTEGPDAAPFAPLVSPTTAPPMTSTPVGPSDGAPLAAIEAPTAAPAGAPAPRPRPPAPCKKTVEVTDEQISIKIINNYCSARVVNLFTWREGGKTHLQFEVDNSGGGAQAHLRMVERWSDLRGRSIGDAIDEQRIAIEARRNKVVVLSGPTPAAMIATITLYK